MNTTRSTVTKYVIQAAFALFVIYMMLKPKPSCNDFANGFKNDVQFRLVLFGKSNDGKIVSLRGEDLNSKKPVYYNERSGGLFRLYEKFKKNDTVIKDKGKYQVIIKRRDSVLTLPFTCNGESFLN